MAKLSSTDDIQDCPICMDPFDADDLNFFPCNCGYQLCRFCWHRIKNDEGGLCPACRNPYSELPASYKPPTEFQNSKPDKKCKNMDRRQKLTDSRKHLANIRVVQRTLLFVVGLPPKLADADILKRNEYFGKFGKIVKCVVNNGNATSYVGSQSPSASAFITYSKPEDSLRAIQNVNNLQIDGRSIKAALGTTKYCSQFLKGQQCSKSDCMYLHELGEEAASFTKEDMQQGKHHEYEEKLHEEFLNKESHSDVRYSVYQSKDPIQTVDYTLKNIHIENDSGQSDLPHADTPSPESSNGWIGTSSSESQSCSNSSSSPIKDEYLRQDSFSEFSSQDPSNYDRCSPTHNSAVHSPPKTDSLHFTNQVFYSSSPHSLLDRGVSNNLHSFLDPPLDKSMYSEYSIPHIQPFSSPWQDKVVTCSKLEDELDFDPFDECQKGFELMERESMIAAETGHSEFSFDKGAWQSEMKNTLPNMDLRQVHWPSAHLHLSDSWPKQSFSPNLHTFPMHSADMMGGISAAQVQRSSLDSDQLFGYQQTIHSPLAPDRWQQQPMAQAHFPSLNRFNSPPGLGIAEPRNINN